MHLLLDWSLLYSTWRRPLDSEEVYCSLRVQVILALHPPPQALSSEDSDFFGVSHSLNPLSFVPSPEDDT